MACPKAYRSGCRCAACKAHEADRQRKYRAHSVTARTKNVVKLRAVRSQPDTVVAAAANPAPEMGPVEQGVREQIDASPRGEQRPGDAATAIRLASLLDMDSHSAMAGQLIMSSLQPPRKKSKSGRLSPLQAVQALTASDKAWHG